MDIAQLTAAAKANDIDLPEEQIAKLAEYCDLLWEWNEKMNLTRHTTYERFVERDLVDSLAFAKFLQPNERVLDLGTGGGVPGIPLAILRPDLQVALSESVAKKANAVADIVSRLGLDVPVYAERAEHVLQIESFDTVVVRAVARLAKLLRWMEPCWGQCKRMLIMKGPAWVDERGEARHHGLMQHLALRKLTSYPLAGTDSESVLLLVCPEKRLRKYVDESS